MKSKVEKNILVLIIFCLSIFSIAFAINVSATTNNPPSWQRIPDQNIKVGERVSISLLNYASDPDGEQLTF